MELATARRRVDIFRSRYAGKNDLYLPIHFALQWQAIFESPESDINAARELVTLANEKKDLFDIAFFTFCNDMEATLKTMMREPFVR